MTKLAFIDTEALGLDQDIHPIFEVGLILRNEEGVDTEYEWWLPVETLAFADPFALKLNQFHTRYPYGIGNIDAKDGRYGTIATESVTSLSTFAKQFIALTSGCHWVGAVPGFDEERLRRLVRSEGLIHDWHYHLTCVEVLAVGYLSRAISFHTAHGKMEPSLSVAIADNVGMDVRPPWDSKAISRALGLDPDSYEQHTAMGDCRWARDMYDAVMG